MVHVISHLVDHMNPLISWIYTHLFQLVAGFSLASLAAGIIFFIHQPLSPNHSRCTMVPWEVYLLCKQSQTVTSELARDPSQCPETVFHKLYEKHHSVLPGAKCGSTGLSAEEFNEKDEQQRAHACGNWGSSEPSELFLQVRHLI